MNIDAVPGTAKAEIEVPSPKTTAPKMRLPGNPFTDSGYESARTLSGPPDESCGESLYTDGSITDTRSAKRYAEELAADIYNALRLEEKKKEWKAISKFAPKLLKAFAIKVGCYSGDPLMRIVMKFVHRRSQ